MAELVQVFQNAALPQKLVFVLLLASVLAALAAALMDLRAPRKNGRLLSKLVLAAPLLGLLAGSMNAFHMMHTTLRLPTSPSAKDLAPGVMEIAALVGIGALAGLVAMASKALTVRVQAPRGD